jgi:hypothetical protein
MARKLKEEHEKWGLTMNLEKTKYVWMGEGKEILKLDGGEEIKTCTECTYLGTKIDQLGNNTAEIKTCTECTYLGTKIDQLGDNTAEIKTCTESTYLGTK